MINKNVILYLTNVIGFFSHIIKSLQKPWYKRRSLDKSNVYNVGNFCNYTYQTQNKSTT